MRITFTWTSAGTIASLLALALAGWLAFTSGTLSAPKLEFGFGFVKGKSGGDLRNAGLKKNGPVKYLVMATEHQDAHVAVFIIPFYVANESSRAQHDVLVRFTYPTRAAVAFEKVTLIDPSGEARLDAEYLKLRTVNTSGTTATTEFRIPVLRPGEGVILGDIFMLGNPELSTRPPTKGKSINLLPFPDRLSEQVDLRDILRVQAFAASAEAGPYTANLTVIWTLSSPDEQAIEALGDRITNAAWGPYRLKPGLYFKWPWDPDLSQTEFFEFILGHLDKGVTDLGTQIYVQRFEETDMVAFSSSMPPWDYWGSLER